MLSVFLLCTSYIERKIMPKKSVLDRWGSIKNKHDIWRIYYLLTTMQGIPKIITKEKTKLLGNYWRKKMFFCIYWLIRGLYFFYLKSLLIFPFFLVDIFRQYQSLSQSSNFLPENRGKKIRTHLTFFFIIQCLIAAFFLNVSLFFVWKRDETHFLSTSLVFDLCANMQR